MNQRPHLLLAALGLLWLQLVATGQLQPPVASALLLVMALSWRTAAPPPLARHGITAAAVLIWATGASLADRTAMLQSGSELIWLLCGLKLLEARTAADQRRCTLLLLLAIGLAGLGSPALGASLLLGGAALLALAALLQLETGWQQPGRVLRRCCLLVAWSLPLWIATFVLMPRLEPLWSLPIAGKGRSGLSDRLNAGALASLVQDDGLAARLQLDGIPPPPPAQRYWRVLVHQQFDGSTWTSLNPQPLGSRQSRQGTGAQEQWLVEPTGLRQRPWSGRGQPLSSDLQTTTTGTLISASPLQQRSLYSLSRIGAPGPWQQRPPTAADWQLPATANPRLRALGRQWRQQAASPEARLNLARRWFARQGFRYTLEPGALGSINPIDGFLFERRAGFCEHFAASFSALMRAAGVPARVVVGYQGGRWQQPFGSPAVLELRNSDAHAWSEVWLPARGWITVDPTAWVAPERVRRSLAASLSPADQALLRPAAPPWLEAIAGQWRGLDYRWQHWVMGFDRQQQLALLGDNPLQGLNALVVMALALSLGVLGIRGEPDRRDPVERQLRRLLLLLERRGHGLMAGETLDHYSLRIGRELPALAPQLRELSQLYENWRFGPQAPTRQGRKALLQAIARCRTGLGPRPATRAITS